MFKSLRNMFFLILLGLFLFSLFIIMTILIVGSSNNNNNNNQYSKNVDIYKVNENYLQITENVIVDINDNNINNFSFPISLYKDYTDYSYSYVDLIDTTVSVNNETILTESQNAVLLAKEMYNQKNNINSNDTQLAPNVNKDIIYSDTFNQISISTRNNMNFPKGRYIITVSYKCNVNDVINTYNNVSILKVRRNSIFNNLNITLTLPRASSTFEVSSNKAIIENKSNNIYIVQLSNVNSSSKLKHVNLVFDNNMFSNANIINENYNISTETSIFATIDKTSTILFYIITIITILLFIIILILTRKVKLEKIYVRDTKSVISPLLAESLIDKKMRFKRTYNDMHC